MVNKRFLSQRGKYLYISSKYCSFMTPKYLWRIELNKFFAAKKQIPSPWEVKTIYTCYSKITRFLVSFFQKLFKLIFIPSTT